MRADASDFESAIFCDIKLNDKDNLLVGVCYRSPNSTAENNNKFFDMLNQLEKVSYSHTLLIGDFNFPEINWINGQVTASDTHPATVFYDSVHDLFLYHHVDFPTRYREGQEPSTLDLILTNEEFMIEELTDIAPLGKSDHVGLTWMFVCNSCISTREEEHGTGLNFSKGEYDQMRQSLNAIDWEEQMKSLDCEESWTFFRGVYNKAVEDYVPKYKSNKKKKPPWICGR